MRLSAEMETPSSAFGEKSDDNADSISVARKTPSEPAPVTATRTPFAVFAAKTPTKA